ncbi:MAG: AbrB/MazE/SpoVT family DNA-binding domain-containing protein [Hyphomicrobiales bacterium]
MRKFRALTGIAAGRGGAAYWPAIVLTNVVKRVDIIRHGTGRLIVPAGESWEAFFAGPRLDADFLAERAQPLPQRRDDA